MVTQIHTRQFYNRLGTVLIIAVLFAVATYGFMTHQDLIMASLQPKNLGYYYNAYSRVARAGELTDHPAQAGSVATGVPILVYHSILDQPADNFTAEDGTNVSLQNFTDQMIALHKAGYHTVSIEDAYAFMQGTKSLPDKSFVLTFDDGRKQSYYPADPLLKALDYKAVMYVITNRIQNSNPYHLTQAELQRMVDSGRWELQSHGRADHDLYAIDAQGTKGHFMSDKLWLKAQNRLETTAEFQARVLADMIAAKADLFNKFHVNAISYAFPFGDYGQASTDFKDGAQPIVLKDVSSVYPIGLYQAPVGSGPLLNYVNKNQFFTKRIDVRPQWTATDLMRVVAVASPKSLPYTPSNFKIPDWTLNWGEVAYAGNTIKLDATKTETGSFLFLDGSMYWKDYQYTTHARLTKGSTLALIARYQDNKNYVDCDFGPTLIHIDANQNGDRRVIQGSTYSGMPNNEADIGIRVRGRDVQCLLNGKVIIDTPYLDPGLTVGGIALKSWDQAIDNSEAYFSNIKVTEIH